ncbi:SAM-dependent methyltransferase [Streptomyces sp. SID3343]|uniref:SAM-dependent methyltransferase n=1 Tax=Streptomyces sp. SID3343 TaxID=2690260 RepID=UPI0013703B25|nr:SAM-dependent methyltransferase [Streptomyces sp. SID3343]MYW00403.1 SAM-dependent methyltransferase [Streptomyces sp. SID3343]
MSDQENTWRLPATDDPDEWVVPPEIDTSRAHPARIYDYFLGGKNNFAADRDAAEQVIAVAPSAVDSARGNRAFLGRAVKFLAQAGIRQFLDIGTGIPSAGNTHEVAQAVRPDARVAYLDNDPIVLVHARALMTGDGRGRIAYVPGDVRTGPDLLDLPEVREVLDFDEPIALLLLAILHFVRDSEDPTAIVAGLRDALPAGSHLVLSHGTADFDLAQGQRGTRIYDRATAQLALRPHADIEKLFEGFELLDPGLVRLPLWHPEEEPPHDHDPDLVRMYGGVGRKT